MPACGGYDNSPVVAWQPVNGTLVMMIRQVSGVGRGARGVGHPPLYPFCVRFPLVFLNTSRVLTPSPLHPRPSQMDDLDIHEMHLTDPTDPDSWSNLRGPACLCNFPPCKVGAA